MIKDLNGLTVLILVVTILAVSLSLGFTQSPARNGWTSYDTVGGVPVPIMAPSSLGRPTDHHSLCFSPPSSRSLLNHRSGS